MQSTTTSSAAAVALLLGLSVLTQAGTAQADPASAPDPNRPATLPYDEESSDAPHGYRLKTTRHTGIAIPGAILTSIGAPFLIAGVADCAQDGCIVGLFGIFLGTLFVAPGLPLLLVGLIERKEWVRDDGAAAARTPRPEWASASSTASSAASAPHQKLTIGWAF
jgi:hypothetical protein